MQKHLGKYELLERLGQGSHTTVYRARDTELDRIFAIKVIDQSVVNEPGFGEHIMFEAGIACSLDHPNVLSVYDYQIEDGRAYIVTEYLPNTLDHLLKSQRRLSPRRATDIAIQICRGLAYAHRERIIHRNIKPTKILLTDEGNIKISDFGLTRAYLSYSEVTTSVIGTPSYMSPEHWVGGRLDGRADIYSLGILLYEMLTGSLPFQAQSLEALYEQHQNDAVPDLPGNLNIPFHLKEVINKSMAKRLELRFQSAEQMERALDMYWSHHRSEETCKKAGFPISGWLLGIVGAGVIAGAIVLLYQIGSSP